MNYLNEIAVIGMSCRFPGASDYEAYWENLKEARSSVTEVPPERWDWKRYWGDPQSEKNKSNSKWGGFLDGVDQFDADFFGLSAKEVETMDPQQRIMLELTWSCFEDAGILPSRWSGKKVGVFLGVFNFDYKELQEYGGERPIEAHHSTGTASALIANRISYYFNFKGPSFPIDTACSSSLSAIHSAVQSLQHGECDLAVAGGINLLLTPTRHISFSKTGMLSPSGSCKSFDDSADGYVRGEGAGTLLLKSLEQALKDGDPVYGVIKGSAVNHGGKTYSLTYPNPVAQKEVIIDAQTKGGIAPESIGYIEAHGTGTPKGDPIEFQGLTEAFLRANPKGQAYTGERYCGLGSVKSNIGHLEAAAGVAGIIKVLLSMKYRQLPGLQNFHRVNHRISIDQSPFYIVDVLQEWKPLLDENHKELPRRAGVSSFGFGGTNAHVVLEEAPASGGTTATKREDRRPPYYLVCLSARTADNLMRKELDLANWLNLQQNQLVDIADICRTLSSGREQFAKKTVLIIKDIRQLKENLGLPDSEAGKGILLRNPDAAPVNPAPSELLKEICVQVAKKLEEGPASGDDGYRQSLLILAELYLQGVELDIEKPWLGRYGRRIGLPAYPFTKNHYWIPEPETEKDAGIMPSLSGRNISGFSEQKFSLLFTGKEFFLNDHRLQGLRVLPAAAYLEMARAAIVSSTEAINGGDVRLCLKNIMWARPLQVDEKEVQVYSILTSDEEDNVYFEIKGDTVSYSQGSAGFTTAVPLPRLDIGRLKEQTDEPVLEKATCYRIFRTHNFDYGPAHCSIQAIYSGNGIQLAKLCLPPEVITTLPHYFIHPSLADGAIQAALLLIFTGADEGAMEEIFLPFALEHLEIARPCTQDMWAVIKRAGAERFDIDLCDPMGEICLRMTGLSFKRQGRKASGRQEHRFTLQEPCWKDMPAIAGTFPASFTKHLIFLCEPGEEDRHPLEERFPGASITVLQGGSLNAGRRYQDYAVNVFEDIQTLLKGKAKGKILVQIVVFERGSATLFQALSGLLKTVRLENPEFTGQIITVPSGEMLSERLRQDALSETDHQINYTDGTRRVFGWKESAAADQSAPLPWKEQGTYLITGGAGGLGLIFAREIAERTSSSSIILTGRSSLNELQIRQIDQIRAAGARVEYRNADLSDDRSVMDLIAGIRKDFNGLNGIIHGAGIVRDNFIIRKTREEFLSVLSPKVLGVTHLDECTADMALDLFVLFSSVVGSSGNVGQADYAAANAFLDAYAGYRNDLAGRGKRQGFTLSINWPLWKEGGMRLGKAMEEAWIERMNMHPLDTASGVAAFYRAVARRISVIGVIPPVAKKEISAVSLAVSPEPSASYPGILSSTPKDSLTNKKAVQYFKELLSVTIKRPVTQIDASAALEAYGIDSVLVMQMTNQLETVFGSLPKTLFFEYQNILELTEYFIAHHADKLGTLLGRDQLRQAPLPAVPRDPLELSPGRTAYGKKSSYKKNGLLPQPNRPGPLDIAIIGLSGRYPKADTLQKFWNNLCNGIDCISEIPSDRWDYRFFFDPDKEKEGKSYSKWGGFIDDVDKFDPLFFNISPWEAERMDPQERLFLQCVYETLEDAGYTRHSLGRQEKFGLGGRVGVYVGVMYEEYQLFGAQETLQGRPVALWGLPSSIANRVSYFCDFHGPSMAVDTMCSSSLTAIHLACESLVRGNCDAAIAGGVNVSIHPNKYLFLSQGRFASSKGRCESFGVGGDGYVPGEGVGAVLLKPLKKAIADRDNIYGVIKSTAISHGGKTNGYTVPNLKAQASTIRQAFVEAGINPRAISYLEAHGTGTSLGDPIEIAALSKVMQEHTSDTQFCPIGSAKSNIGHCESAAGIAGITKVLLQLKHRKIAPSLHSGTLNAHIDFAQSPFFVQQDLAEWRRPVLEEKGEFREYPRCAGISSFGAGGSNAHVVIEEYTDYTKGSAGRSGGATPHAILLSAMDKKGLAARAEALLEKIRELNEGDTCASPDDDPRGHRDDRLPDIAYTLQVGREHLGHRLGLLVNSIHELQGKLADFLSGRNLIHGLYQGEVIGGRADEEENAAATWIFEKKIAELISGWVEGLNVNWELLYTDGRYWDSQRPRRISLPTYPFKRDRYWIGENDSGGRDRGASAERFSPLHPLLHENISDLSGQRFTVTFTGEEPYLKDHVVNERKILPAAASLEMVVEAVWRSTKYFNDRKTGIQIHKMRWLSPIVLEEGGVRVNIELQTEANGEVIFEIYGEDKEGAREREIFSQGSAVVLSLTAPPSRGTIEIEAVRQECVSSGDGAACYAAFERIGFHYGPAHRGLEKVYVGDHSILAKITLPQAARQYAGYTLHPGLVDPALQATLLWNGIGEDKTMHMHVPVSVEEVRIYRPSPESAWVIIHKRGDVQDLEILDEAGNVCVHLRGVSFRIIPSKSIATLLLCPEWEKKEADTGSGAIGFETQVIVLASLEDATPGLEKAAHALEARFPDAAILSIPMRGADDFRMKSMQIFEKVKALLQSKEKGHTLVQVMMLTEGDMSVFAGIAGLLKTAKKENPRFFGQVIRVYGPETAGVPKILSYDAADLEKKIGENKLATTDQEIRYVGGIREVRTWKILEEINPRSAKEVLAGPWKERGVYLITGGTGGLGFIFANEIAENTKEVILVLTGRSAPDRAKQEKIDELQKSGARVLYRQMDVTDPDSVQKCIRSVYEEFGSLSGIIHSAGTMRDNYLVNKSAMEWNEVLSPKVDGIRYLDLATQDIPLDLFIFFSSISGAIGNPGQADYACANAFMDAYAEYRNVLVAKGLRRGHTLSLNWPLWKEGGMQVDKETEKMLFDSMGTIPLSTTSALASFYRALSSGRSGVMVTEGDRYKIQEKIILGDRPVRSAGHVAPQAVPGDSAWARDAAIRYLKTLLSTVIKLPVDQIGQETAMENYGIDSVMVMKMTGKLEKVFGPLSKTLFFEYQNIQALAEYFLLEHADGFAAILDSPEAPVQTEKEAERPEKKSGRTGLLHTKRQWRSMRQERHSGAFDIAIIGISGKYPQADDLDTFWKNLCLGKDCITEIPDDRWDYRLYFEADKDKEGKTYSKWGGFLNRVDEFDPLFFNISPREAELMDPQERLFLQCAYETVEDAGYSRQSLSAENENGSSGNVGVYVGVMYEEYQLYGVEERRKGRNIALSGNPSSIANRVSYFYNFNGPSMAVDTMCSSSLTAIHLACQGILTGDCQAAIAGGVNISIHPNKYLLLAQGKFISGKGRCESFGIGGDGYVPGEGVGAVLLKPLSQAQADGDHIYAVIKATAVNHGGKTNGYTVPNPNAHAKVIEKACRLSGIDARTISYLEAHGTGTSLGDPIEIAGLKKAFRSFTPDTGFCAIGSVKSNIGHGESAAGIAGLTKIILQLKHKQLAPSLHSEELNPHIDFEDSPFVVQQHLSAWERPIIGNNGQPGECLRRAGLSSFGAGGSNVHLIVEEYDEGPYPTPWTGAARKRIEPVPILLSAKNSDRLEKLAERMVKVMRSGQYSDNDLADIAYTLQTGRDWLETRLAMIVCSMEELCDKLDAFLRGEKEIEGIYYGIMEKDKATAEAFKADEELREAINKWLLRKKYSRLCAFWVKGIPVDWAGSYLRHEPDAILPRKLSLPPYPFSRERYWVPGNSGLTNAEPFNILTFEEEWVQQAVDKESAVPPQEDAADTRKWVCFLSDEDRRVRMAEELRQIDKTIELLFISRSQVGNAGLSSWKSLLRELAGDKKEIAAFVYLWAIEDGEMVRDMSPIVYLLQAIGIEKLKPGKIVLAGAWNSERSPRSFGNDLDPCYLESWIGFARSARLVLPETPVSVIFREYPAADSDFSHWVKPIWAEWQQRGRQEALYRGDQRWIYRVRKSVLRGGAGLLKHGGNYLITGGLGGLGLVFANHLAEKYKANLILTGRSPVSDHKQRSIDRMRQCGSRVTYLQGDVCDMEKMKEGLAIACREIGSIDGVIHAAGVEQEGTLLDRDIGVFEAVLAPKIRGTILLDELLKDEPLDFVCYFSSSAAVLGDFGSCDYATGNRFQMAFAKYRAQLETMGSRRGKTIAINWPLWKEGGMGLKQEASTGMYLKSSGQRFLENTEGLAVFERLLVQGLPAHQLVLVGKEQSLSSFLGLAVPAPDPLPGQLQDPPQRQPYDLPGQPYERAEVRLEKIVAGTGVGERLESDLRQIAGDLLKISHEQMDIHANLADIGFDSVTLTKFASLLTKKIKIDIAPALFFSYSTIESLTGYLLKEYNHPLAGLYQEAENKTPEKGMPETKEEMPLRAPAPPASPVPVAIIGMSGRFPGARNPAEMWKILVEGASAVQEIPEDRWDWRAYYGGENMQEGKTNCKWTGLIPGIREFDPLFFEISPAEAGAMDPRQRLLLEEGWKALEDAGYGKKHIGENKVALYVGVEENSPAGSEQGMDTVTGHHNAILAARLSYFLNLSGPNMAINTACSSGLVAAHQAFQSLQLKECDTAIAAGINIMMSPEPYVTMSQAGMLSPDGVCHTFDKRANGMVPGEAVAVVVLKRLPEAIADGDPIYATIRGSGINYDGKTNGITAPSSLSQTALLRSVYSQCQVNPEKVEYIIAHGTGTRLGDPVEIHALNDAFSSYTNRQHYCALTSNKTNFGHTFAASGLVSLINLVQSLRHEAIPPSLHCNEQSDYLPLDKSPFFINRRVKAWPSVPGKPRLGGVSAFGMSGTNAHMVLESYAAEKRPPAGDHPSYYLLPLSGKTEVALKERISQLILAFENGELHGSLMEEVSYTLMEGRHHFKYRCAVIAKDHIEALHVLKLAAGKKPGAQWVSGEVSRDFKAGREISGLLTDLAAQRNLYALAEQYCQGHDIPWGRLFPGKIPGRVHLPTYPFSRKEYRMSKGKKDGSALLTKQWLTIREELISAAIPEGIDWNVRLGSFAGKRICIVYWQEEDRSGLTDLLEKLERASRMQGKLDIQILQVNNLNTEAIKKIRPEIVMVPGMPERGTAAEQPAKADLSVILQLSKTLMQSAWDDPIRIYFLYHSDPVAPHLECEALSGFFRSAVRENEKHSWKVIRLYREDRAGERYQILLKEWLLEELTTSNARSYTEIHYRDGQRFIKKITETELPVAVKPAFRVGGSYLVVGGTGFVGEQLCREIALKYQARLFILSRSPHDEKINEQRRRLQDLGGEVHFFSADATEPESLENVYRQIKSIGGDLHGVINLARAHDSHIIANKSWESFDKVSMSKIRSAQYLDQLTKDEPLDFFMMFASMAAFGVSGESDYAYSCAFQNAFASNRNRMTEEGKRSGVSVTLCWGPWVEDKLFPEHAEKMKDFGCDLIDMSDAFPLIEASCSDSGGAIGIIAVRNVDKIRNWFGIEKGNTPPAQQDRAENGDAAQQPGFTNGHPTRWESTIRKWTEQKKTGEKLDFGEIRRVIPVADMEMMEAGLVERIYSLCFEKEVESVADVSDDLREVIRGVIMEALQVETLDDVEPLQSYGLDSIKAMRLSVNLEKKLDRPVQPQWFIDYPTVRELSQFLTFDQTILI